VLIIIVLSFAIGFSSGCAGCLALLLAETATHPQLIRKTVLIK
jgi:hypothetical protein